MEIQYVVAILVPISILFYNILFLDTFDRWLPNRLTIGLENMWTNYYNKRVDITVENPEKFFRIHPRPESTSELIEKLFTFVKYRGEDYGWITRDNLYHRRGSIIKSSVRITKAPPNAHAFFHTHPGNDGRNSLTSAADYIYMLDNAFPPLKIQHFYTVMKYRIDHFEFINRKSASSSFLTDEECLRIEAYLEQLDFELTKKEFNRLVKHSNPKNQSAQTMQWQGQREKLIDKAMDATSVDKITREMVAWLNKEYGEHVKIQYHCHYKKRTSELDSL